MRKVGIISFVGIVGTGLLLRYTIVPDEEKMLKSLSPETRAIYERNKVQRREQHDKIMEQMIESAKSDKPIWKKMSENKGVNIKNEKQADTAPTPQNTPIFTAPLPTAAAVSSETADALATQNPALLSMLQGRLGSLIGAPSGYIDSLPKAVRERVDGLRCLQQQHTDIDKKLHLEIFELEKKYSELYAPLYARRTEIVQGAAEPTDAEKEEGAKIAEAEKEDAEVESGITEVPEDGEDAEEATGIPEFWLTALRNHPQLAELITDRDEGAIKFLRDIRLVYLSDKPGFKLEFEFAENPYFSNSVLSKTYVYEQSDVAGDLEFGSAQGTEIDWKPENDLSVTVETKKQRHKTSNRTRVVKKTVPAETFFSFFATVEEPESDDDSELADETRDRIELDYELAEEFKEKIVPCAIDWFTGKALAYEGLDEEEYDDGFMDDYYDDEDDDDEDDDEDDDDVDDLSRSAKDAAEPPQCKNQ
ncbi:histone chaperone [Coemansia sp. RSA 2523]|nr:histone chaperone [Coemansia sp. RSA 2167]KAJ1810609.1 histone chaperone [Coemansia sp. RSA 2523]KAJ2275066.1 histone chaperone [Coemansia sp. RSA 370]KAJ2287656.1 histone chaperone [Coemansia sp. RSA 355]KAJ2535767.1 histone chaperone [Coemansia sp. RSA 1935]